MNAPIETTAAWIPMPDGISLAADVHRPAGWEGGLPVLLAMTPYGRAGLGGFIAQYFVPRGYALVVVDVRGRYDSPGTFAPVVQERQDAPSVVDWIARQPWFDPDAGIGVIGLSYLATAGIMAAAARPHVKAASCITIVVDPLESFYRGGVLDLHHAFPWCMITGFSPQPDLRKWDWGALFGHVPLATMDQAAGVDLPSGSKTSWKPTTTPPCCARCASKPNSPNAALNPAYGRMVRLHPRGIAPGVADRQRGR